MKHILKKSIAGVLTMAMVLALAPTMAFAGAPVALGAGTSSAPYMASTAENFIAAAEAGGYVTLAQDVTLTADIDFGQNGTYDTVVDCGDNTIDLDGSYAFKTNNNGIDVTIKNGTLADPHSNGALQFQNSNVDVTMEDVTITGAGFYGVWIMGDDGELDITDCSISHNEDADWTFAIGTGDGSNDVAVTLENLTVVNALADVREKTSTGATYLIFNDDTLAYYLDSNLSGWTDPVTIEGDLTISDDASINSEMGIIVSDGSSLTIADGVELTIDESAEVNVESGATLTIASGVTISNVGTISNSGTIVAADATMADALTESGVSGTITVPSSSSSKSYYIKATADGNGTVAPEDEDVSPDSMYKVDKGDDVTFEFDADSGYEVTDVLVEGKSVGACDEYTFEDIIITMQTIEVVFEKSSSSSSDDDDDEDEDDEEEVDEEIDEDVVEIELPFADIDEDNDNLEGIAYVYDSGIMAGISEDVFGSDLSITRGMIAAILYRVGGSEPVDADMLFADVAADQYYLEAVKWGKAAGVMAGVSETEFAPNTAITGEQFVAFLYRYASVLGMDMSVDYDYDLSGYGISDYAYTAIAWALENDIIDEDDFDATAEALRGDVATALMNFIEMM